MGLSLLGLLAILYSGVVVFITVKKPDKVWQMKKIQAFEKALGEKGTVVFFYVWAAIFAALGIWLLVK